MFVLLIFLLLLIQFGVDFSAAFDTVWRNALIYKLSKVGVGGQFPRSIQNMYTSVSFAVKCEDKLTDTFNTSVGVNKVAF
jgi:hypothetical protein